MKDKKRLPICLAGNDSDDDFAIVIAIMVVVMILSIMLYAGAFIGGFHSLRNYIIAFKHNVIDSNAVPDPV